ncbi:MAG: UDP-N-acetylglucosamine--N-acetylmuramyl-(pentapeptide) pyrophosphoryl-undecaprenol N-acetylglucosamine transferase, partial [Fibrobacteres bacterium]|nr:UDP-N-acetylglucosamine--N-acetylmuramyl-(pentapeptide) pyrophosphoryl-undecaprenol N-acetylglucosamine transferase [Fibrobacterota bacterium]
MKKYDLIIACGGTGGHIYPALAIAEAMKSYHRDVRILFVVRDGAMEQKVFPESGFDFITIKSAGFSRVSLKANIKLLWVLPSSFVKAISVLITAKPSAVLSTGGYSGLPVLAAARILRKKIFLQEQNTYPGVTVRLFAGSADCVYLGYREAAKYLPVQTRYMETGNPIRLATGKAERNIKGELSIEGKKLIFVSGGSQGAQAVNKLIASMLPEFIADESLAVVWQCGRANEDFARKAADGMKNVHVMPFIDNIYDYYKAADLAVCRSGAMT